jgi:phytol kinase
MVVTEVIMTKSVLTNSIDSSTANLTTFGHIRTEVIRKTLHFSIAATPSLAFMFGVQATVIVLAAGVLFYALSELYRGLGVTVPIVSRLTEMAMRSRDKAQFVLGPITLGLGAMLALQLYPQPAASIAIYALAFGDGLSSLVGKLFGTIRLPFTGGKSLEGSLACLLAVFISGLLLVPSFSIQSLTIIALAATILEALPTKDFDNLILPIGTGLVAFLVL